MAAGRPAAGSIANAELRCSQCAGARGCAAACAAFAPCQLLCHQAHCVGCDCAGFRSGSVTIQLPPPPPIASTYGAGVFAALATVVVFAMHGPCCLARACAMAAPAIPVLIHAIQAVSLSRGAAPPAHPPPRPSTPALSLLRQASRLPTPCAFPSIPTAWMGPTPRLSLIHI